MTKKSYYAYGLIFATSPVIVQALGIESSLTSDSVPGDYSILANMIIILSPIFIVVGSILLVLAATLNWRKKVSPALGRGIIVVGTITLSITLSILCLFFNFSDMTF